MSATKFIDFAELKARIRIEQAVSSLGLQMTQKGAQWRGACPACKTGGSRALAVNTDKQSFYCFGVGKGGDIIALAAHIRDLSQKDAAAFLENSLGNSDNVHTVTVNSSPTSPPAPARKFDGEAYAKTLDPAHAALEPLGVSPETLRQFKAGYSSSGVNRGRLALPLHDRNAALVCYFGRTVKNESPTLVFPNGSTRLSTSSELTE